MTASHDRRDFLRGRAAASAAAEAIDAAVDKRLGEAASPETGRAAARVVRLTRRAMACDFEIRINASRDSNATDAGMDALDLVERLEDQLTVYRERSELIDLNRWAAERRVVVEERLFGLLELCDRLHAETGGAFDPTSGPLSRVWGFYQREGRLPDTEDLAASRERVGWRHVRLDHADRSVRFTKAGVELNVNSIGKGYALDRVGELLDGRGVGSFLIHGGRSTLLARGDHATLEGGGWLAGIRDPETPERRLYEVRLRDEALSTSGAGTQFFEHEGRRYGHVLDPRTGRPAAELLYQATAIAPTAAEADALSTAFFVLGVEGTREFCARRRDVKAILLADGGDNGIVGHRFNIG